MPELHPRQWHSSNRLYPSSHDASPHPAAHEAEEQNDEVPKLPPFYSPRPIPVSRQISELDLNSLGVSEHHSQHASSRASSQPTVGSESPLPGLVSPAFTPPSTPGFSTPSSRIDPESRPAKSVPVDSTTDEGGCGSKKPKLLQKLPEVNCVVRARIPTTTGTEMFLHLYQNNEDNKEHLAIVFGDKIRSKSLDAVRPGETEMDRLIRGAYVGRLYPGRTSSRFAEEKLAAGARGHTAGSEQAPLVRIHSECYTGETVWSARCDCGEQLDEAARLMSLPPSATNPSSGGIIIYLRQEGRGIGLSEKLKAYNLQDLGSDTVEANLLLRHPADARSYGLATAMLLDLGVKDIRLLTNNPDKVRAVEGPNREIVVRERVAMIPLAWRKGNLGGGIRSVEIGGYLKTKVCPPRSWIGGYANKKQDREDGSYVTDE
jgi:GTP cyclohydrolase II